MDTDLGAEVLAWLGKLNAENYPAWLEWLDGLSEGDFRLVGIWVRWYAEEVSMMTGAL